MSLRFTLIALARGLLTLFLAVTFVFLALRPAGDPLRLMLPDDTPPAVVERYRQLFGLDQPLVLQYLGYLRGLVQGDFGYSFRDSRPALAVVAERIPQTLELGLTAFALTTVLGVGAGTLAALRRGTAIDHLVITLSVAGHAMPSFFFGIVMILFFAMKWRILPSSGIGGLSHLVLPAVTLGIGAAGTVARFSRSALLEVLHQPYMRTARAKGLSLPRRILRHAFPDAAIPVITLLGLRFGGLIAGAVVVESVFAWPGVGQLLVTSVSLRDLAVVQTIILMVAAVMVAVNLLVDLAYGWLDPRIADAERVPA